MEVLVAFKISGIYLTGFAIDRRLSYDSGVRTLRLIKKFIRISTPNLVALPSHTVLIFGHFFCPLRFDTMVNGFSR
jgi:hypothetical protein